MISLIRRQVYKYPCQSRRASLNEILSECCVVTAQMNGTTAEPSDSFNRGDPLLSVVCEERWQTSGRKES